MLDVETKKLNFKLRENANEAHEQPKRLRLFFIKIYLYVICQRHRHNQHHS